jgi:hypothetical protein
VRWTLSGQLKYPLLIRDPSWLLTQRLPIAAGAQVSATSSSCSSTPILCSRVQSFWQLRLTQIQYNIRRRHSHATMLLFTRRSSLPTARNRKEKLGCSLRYPAFPKSLGLIAGSCFQCHSRLPGTSDPRAEDLARTGYAAPLHYHDVSAPDLPAK